MSTGRFATFGDHGPKNEARHQLAGAGFDSHAVDWLAPLLTESASPSAVDATVGSTTLDRLIRCRRITGTDAGACAAFLMSGPPTLAVEAQQAWAEACAAHGMDLSAQLTALISQSRQLQIQPTAAAASLVRVGQVSPATHIQWEHVLGLAAGRPWREKTHGSNERDREDQDHSGLIFWLAADAPSALLAAAAYLSSVPLQRLAVAGHAVCYAINTFSQRPVKGHHPDTYRDHGPGFAAAAEKVFTAVWSRVQSAPSDQRAAMTHLVLRLHWIAFDGREQEQSEELRGAMLGLAENELGRMRGAIRSSAPEVGAKLLQGVTDELPSLRRALFTNGTLWHGLRAFLLLFRALPVPAVAGDLRWWPEANMEDPPSPWCEVTSALVYGLHGYARFEQTADPQLVSLRESFARFCLDRLKTRKGEDAGAGEAVRVEPHPAWRYAYVRAAQELCVNPGGRGHNTLHAAAGEDPDPAVREAAKSAYADMRHGVALPEGMSPRRAILRATWWLRQAQLLALERNVDKAGARRTSEREIRMTTEAT